VHVATVARKAFARLRHEARCYAKLGSERLDDELKEGCLVRHLLDFAKFESLSNVSLEYYAVAGYATYSFEDAWPRLGVPTLDAAVELGACVEDAVVVLLIVYWSRDAVPEHAFCETWKRAHGVVSQERRSTRRVLLRSIVALGCAKLVKLVLGYTISNQLHTEYSNCSPITGRLTSSHGSVSVCL
jgi:hypothetical protein